MSGPVLTVTDLVVAFGTNGPRAVESLSYELHSGETLGIVGESGAGKSMSLQALLRLVPANLATVSGRVDFCGRNLLDLSEREMRAIRGKRLAMVFQDPNTFFNPVMTIGAQVGEAIQAHHRKASSRAVRARSVELLNRVGIPAGEHRHDQYPHEFSGGMRQRAMIAMAIANQPEVLLADEPTTALDVTVQAQILDLLRIAQEETDAATILVTHDLGVIAEMADRVVVMYAGRAVEEAPVRSIFHDPRHPYTAALLASRPSMDDDIQRLLPVPGTAPSLMDLPHGCAFHPRCAVGADRERCRTQLPALRPVEAAHHSACHFADELRTVDSEPMDGGTS